MASMDSDDVAKVTRAINGVEIGLEERSMYTNRIRKVVL